MNKIEQDRNVLFERWFETKPEQKNWYPNPNADAQWTAFDAGYRAAIDGLALTDAWPLLASRLKSDGG